MRYRRLLVLAPVAKQKDYGRLELTMIYAEERGRPKAGSESVGGYSPLLLRSCAEAIKKLQ